MKDHLAWRGSDVIISPPAETEVEYNWPDLTKMREWLAREVAEYDSALFRFNMPEEIRARLLTQYQAELLKRAATPQAVLSMPQERK